MINEGLRGVGVSTSMNWAYWWKLHRYAHVFVVSFFSFVVPLSSVGAVSW